MLNPFVAAGHPPHDAVIGTAVPSRQRRSLAPRLTGLKLAVAAAAPTSLVAATLTVRVDDSAAPVQHAVVCLHCAQAAVATRAGSGVVLDTPFSAVSDAAGLLELNLPAGQVRQAARTDYRRSAIGCERPAEQCH